MTVSHSQNAGLVAQHRKGSKQVPSAPVGPVEHDTRAAWWGTPVVPAWMILDGGTAFRCQKGLQVASDLAVTSGD
ncbi:hypothetical protein [Celeribacter indicus]|uniref:Uncharacterized protein n=1 Tax=Celeribacter indicus TaxID=1208324 RepID=A0A0B5E613_9RHOB|nr:hypothetical protein [Celeribacter indicus]AJE48476.1 hypothetical protein P73_3761 [Celeribacter indicus]SDX48199.1 hypothetical protein SAMN05443573_13133 [Celeribacter indicus]